MTAPEFSLIMHHMMIQSYPLPKLQKLPATLPGDGAISIAIEEGVPIFRASTAVQEHIQDLLDKQRQKRLTSAESDELDRYAEIDDYLSHLNRLIRNMIQ